MQKLLQKLTSAVVAIAMIMSSSAIVFANNTPNGEQEIPIQAQLYVTLNGNDTDGDGTSAAPFATIERARQEVAKINDDMTGNIIVNVGGGDYYLDNTITFGEKDSGTNGYEVIYKSADGIGEANLIGGDKITGWELATQDDATGFDLDSSLVGKVYKVQLDKDTYDFNTMYVNDSRAVMARTRNRDNNPGFPMAKGEYMRSKQQDVPQNDS